MDFYVCNKLMIYKSDIDGHKSKPAMCILAIIEERQKLP